MPTTAKNNLVAKKPTTTRHTSRLQLAITTAHARLCAVGSEAQIVKLRTGPVLLLGSAWERPARIHGSSVLEARDLALTDSVGAPLLIKPGGRHLGVFHAIDGTLVSFGRDEFLILLDRHLHAVDEAAFRWLLKQQRLVADLNRKVVQAPLPHLRLAPN
jgi:hypothetical protein